jgi:hypothetical protein
MRNENASFISFENINHGLIFDDSNHPKYPIRYYNIINGAGLPDTSDDCSYYGYCYDDRAANIIGIDIGLICDVSLRIQSKNFEFQLHDGQSFSINGSFEVFGYGKMILIEVLHTKGIYPETKYRAMNTLNGPIEDRGRLKYIDGCTDTLLIAPVKMGDPCLNHLHFPTDIDQTMHTHPSHRIGIVAKGNGECITPFGLLPLRKGMIFVIKEGDDIKSEIGLDGKTYPVGSHCFRTLNETMDVIAFHPDSDFGATDINHPMINRTIVNGISAKDIESIRTK